MDDLFRNDLDDKARLRQQPSREFQHVLLNQAVEQALPWYRVERLGFKRKRPVLPEEGVHSSVVVGHAENEVRVPPEVRSLVSVKPEEVIPTGFGPPCDDDQGMQGVIQPLRARLSTSRNLSESLSENWIIARLIAVLFFTVSQQLTSLERT